jgi:hypothetical protein
MSDAYADVESDSNRRTHTHVGLVEGLERSRLQRFKIPVESCGASFNGQKMKDE